MEENNYGVFQKGGSVGSHDHFVCTGLTKEDAKLKAARLRKMLTPGERHYYSITYVIKKCK